MKRKIALLGIFLLCMLSIQAKPFRFRLQLADKQGTTFSLQRPLDFLSEKAIKRRQNQHVQVDSTDLPISQIYLDKIAKCGTIRSTSKWTNTVLVEVKDSIEGLRLTEKLPFVKSSVCVWSKPKKAKGPAPSNRKDMLVPDSMLHDNPYGTAWNQLHQLNGDSLHLAGFKGQGMTVGIIDGGFMNADIIPAFQNTHILGIKNMVHPERNAYDEQPHGMMVLSCMGLNKPGVMIGTAPEADYWLIASEDNDSEQLSEMDFWAAAIEFADSVGVDVVNTSLGYTAFDDTRTDLTYDQLDGRTTLISQAASMCAAKGIVLVVSAGNAGTNHWKKITPPADAQDVLTVGAVDDMGHNTIFSSLGYTTDGRVKPDVCARGGQSTVIHPDGTVDTGNGTSFASPILAGLVTCLWQACPQLTAYQIMDAVRKSGNNTRFPNEVYGYGIPDFWKAYKSIKP